MLYATAVALVNAKSGVAPPPWALSPWTPPAVNPTCRSIGGHGVNITCSFAINIVIAFIKTLACVVADLVSRVVLIGTVLIGPPQHVRRLTGWGSRDVGLRI